MGRCIALSSEIVHPETGEVLTTEEEWRSALQAVEERLAPLYVIRRELRERHAEAVAGPELPSPTRRTEKQHIVARCPRCGGRLESETAPE